MEKQSILPGKGSLKINVSALRVTLWFLYIAVLGLLVEMVSAALTVALFSRLPFSLLIQLRL